MRFRHLVALTTALGLFSVTLAAQENKEVEQLRKQLKELRESFEKAQQEQRRQIEALTRQIGALQQQAGETAKGRTAETAGAKVADAPPPPLAESQKWKPSQPIGLARSSSAYMNLSFDALMGFGWSTTADPAAQLQLGDHDPVKRGFSLRNAEIALDGAVDPYFKGFANIVFKLDKNNETELELEEAYLQSTSLPANLQLKAGQFFASFGRQNPQHPHQWAFVDQPLVLNRAFGPDGLRNLGAQLSWLAPTPFYTEVFLGVMDGQGSTAFGFRNPGENDSTGTNRFHGRATLDRRLRGPTDLLFVPRLVSSFDLTDAQTLMAGVSGAFGPNATGPRNRTEIYGVDAFWKWKSPRAMAGFPFVSLQTEALYSRFGAAADSTGSAPLPPENLRDWGLYSQLLWGFKPRWVTGLRGEYVNGNRATFDSGDVFRGGRSRVSPVLTWYPSEFSKIRLQYNYDQGEVFGTGHSIWLQMEFLLGAHGAHKF